MHLREAQPTDAAPIAQVRVDTWRTAYQGIVPDDYLASLSYEPRILSWRNRIESVPGWFTFVVEDKESTVVGFVEGGPERNAHPLYTGEIGAIYLRQAYHRRGIGRQLMSVAAQRLLQQGHSALLLWVLAANPSRLFYEALGGTLVGEKEVTIGGAKLVEVVYGWSDIRALANR